MPVFRAIDFQFLGKLFDHLIVFLLVLNEFDIKQSQMSFVEIATSLFTSVLSDGMLDVIVLC